MSYRMTSCNSYLYSLNVLFSRSTIFRLILFVYHCNRFILFNHVLYNVDACTHCVPIYTKLITCNILKRVQHRFISIYLTVICNVQVKYIQQRLSRVPHETSIAGHARLYHLLSFTIPWIMKRLDRKLADASGLT